MRVLNRRQWITLALFIAVIFSLSYYANHHNVYTLRDISSLIEDVDISSASSFVANPLAHSDTKKLDNTRSGKGRFINNNDPEVLEKHKIEIKVNELLKKKIDEELEHERKQLEEEKTVMKHEMSKIQKENDLMKKEMDEFQKLNILKVETITFEEPNKNYFKKIYSFKTTESDGPKKYDPMNNELVVLASVHSTFGIGRGFEDFFKLIDGLDFPQSKTSISLLISNELMFKKIDNFVKQVFRNIESTTELEELKESFNKITLLYAPFLESKFKIGRSQRQNDDVQKQRRKVLALMRNFLVTNGVDNEKYSLFIDADVIEVPKTLMQTFTESGKDIATIRIDMKAANGAVVHPDYDLNAWVGERIKPTPEEEAKLDSDPEFKFIPRPGKNSYHFQDICANLEKFGLDKSPSSALELTSVGGAVLFVKSEIFKQGIMFPPYYAIGTTWDRPEGWDGVETEGLCYQAKAAGYSCWGFPNLIGYHTTAV